MSRVLFIRPKKKTDTHLMPHLGLGMLSAVLKARGHEVLVADHMLFQDTPPPTAARLISDFSPDIIGVSMYTATAGECLRVIDEITAVTDKPVMVGGPHASIYSGDLALNPGISYIFKGEAELSIAGVVEKSGRPAAPVIVEARPPDVNALPCPDFSSFLNKERIKIYPLVTSRGCPFQCSFCVVRQVSTAAWRGRDHKACADEVEKAAGYLKGLELVKISDDCPTLDLDRFKAFLRDYAGRKLGLPMTIDNTRADRIDGEFARLAKEAGNGTLCVAVEHGDPEVFGLINKGESLETIRKAAETIKSNGLELRLCFVIGLPGDSLKKTEASIKLAKELKPVHIYWNMAHPLKGTRIRDWFEKNGAEISGDLDYTSYDAHSLLIREPLVSTSDFTREDRKKAYFRAVVETDQYNLSWSEAALLVRHCLRYGYIGIAALSLLRKLGALLAGKYRGALRRAGRLLSGGGRDAG